MPADPHSDTPLRTTGESVEDADQAVILLHGRGASAQSILQLADRLPQENTAFLAPQAADRTWYPHSFLEPIQKNQPHLDSALSRISRILDDLQAHGLEQKNVHLIGFSQGGCLATEYAVRNGDRSGSVNALSGGLIGDELDETRYADDLAGTPVFLGCSDRDPHIPIERVDATAEVFEQRDAAVEKRIYEGMGHTVNDDEITYLQDQLSP